MACPWCPHQLLPSISVLCITVFFFFLITNVLWADVQLDIYWPTVMMVLGWLYLHSKMAFPLDIFHVTLVLPQMGLGKVEERRSCVGLIIYIHFLNTGFLRALKIVHAWFNMVQTTLFNIKYISLSMEWTLERDVLRYCSVVLFGLSFCISPIDVACIIKWLK